MLRPMRDRARCTKADRETVARTFEKTDAGRFRASNMPTQYVASYADFKKG
jgi:hypothetical protein